MPPPASPPPARVLAINSEDELDEAELEGFQGEAQTLLCSNTLHDGLLQVTAAGVRLVSGASGQLLDAWQAPSGQSINVASSSPTQVGGLAPHKPAYVSPCRCVCLAVSERVQLATQHCNCKVC
jgi:hypothetical protein